MRSSKKKILLPALIVFTALFIILFTVISAESVEKQLLPEQFPDGFKLTKPVEYYDPGNLFELINGQAVFYLSYGFVKLDHAFYEKEGVSYKVDVYELRDGLSALGSYRAQKDDDAAELNAGTEGYIFDYLASFYKDKYYIEIVPTDEGDIPVMKLLAGHVEKRIPGTSDLPKELSLFPLEGIIPDSESYYGENLLSYTFLGHGITAEYKQSQGGKNLRVYISFAQDDSHALKIIEDFKEKIKNASSIALPVGISGISGEMPYRGKSMIFHYQKYVFGCLGYTDEKETLKILEILFENLKNADK